jgi:hypothetical protein
VYMHAVGCRYRNGTQRAFVRGGAQEAAPPRGATLPQQARVLQRTGPCVAA